MAHIFPIHMLKT